uniref:hypothetical protein n=1 Tax=Microzonia abyssicola TaxID=217214 RepID=UPI002E76A2B8|nr:hypothetical protein V2497_pgp012 [Syringoderma abyssicola]WAM65077.1 hypothetical protein [Syringoderma abyssicola]
MNHAICLVKVIKKPVELIYNENRAIEVGVQFPGPLKKTLVNEMSLILWGEYREDFLNYYKIQDYLIIEGIITSKASKTDESIVKIIAQRIYPFLLY